MKKKLTRFDLQKMKTEGRKAVWVTAYDYITAQLAEEAGVDCIKLEGGTRVASVIRAISDDGMLVMGHVGLTPQSSGAMGGFRAQGRTADSAKAIIENA